MRKSVIRMAALLFAAVIAFPSLAAAWGGVTGFATYDDLGQAGVTGGGSGEVVHVSTRADLARYAAGTTPYVIIIDKDITGGGAQDLQDELPIGSNKTIIGAGAGKTLNGVALIASNQSNIIIRNIFLKKGRIDGVAFHNCHHVWVDHCDFSDSYDGLLDITNGSDFFTVSWVKLHNHNKVSITNSGTCHYEDYGKERVTFAHCMFKDNTQRNPRIGYGKMHIYNSYWENISSYCIGFHSQAQVLSENNHFSSSAKKPFCNQYSDKLPYCGYLTDRGSYFANGDPGKTENYPFTDISYSPAEYYDYDFDLDATGDVVNRTPSGVGPRDGIQYEPILNPGNGAIDVRLSQRLSWGKVDGAASSKMFFGTSPDNLTETTPDAVVLKPATRYWWKVVAVVGGKEYPSPVYTFRTAGEKASKPYPADGEEKPWLRYPSDGRTFCTDMPLRWRPAADAKEYRVSVAESEAQLDASPAYAATTTGLQTVPPALSTRVKYFWRVDAVKADGTVVKGDVWTFGTSEKQWVAGKNQTEKLYLSGIAFIELNGEASGRYFSVGDQGPGAICGTWGGAQGRYAFETAVYAQTLGANYVGVSVNGKLIDAWYSTDEKNGIEIRKTRNTAMLSPGDDIRIDFVAGLVEGKTNQSRARIDYVNITEATAEYVEVTRPSGIYHAPVSTPGYDCEYLPLKTILFTDTLATVGQKDELQVTDRYCPWISKTDGGLKLWLMQTAMVKAVYRTATGMEQEETFTLDNTAELQQDVALEKDGAQLFALRLYKTMPAKTIYYQPKADAGKDHELLWSPDVVFLDSQGEKGNAGKVQIRDAYEEWIKYYNPTANEVQAKEGVGAFIDPTTDAPCSAFYPKGKDGCKYSYVVGTEKYATYCLDACSRIKFYYTGTGGSATAVNVTVVNMDTEEQISFTGEEAKGKNVASAVTEAELDPNCRYAVRIAGSTGDMLIYAVKMWPGKKTSGIENAQTDGNAGNADVLHNVAGQRVASSYKGIVINGRRKIVNRQ